MADELDSPEDMFIRKAALDSAIQYMGKHSDRLTTSETINCARVFEVYLRGYGNWGQPHEQHEIRAAMNAAPLDRLDVAQIGFEPIDATGQPVKQI